ncbi:multidrug resistance protein homolog 49 [Anabrus simplex]|uniref:multidrug resistance protein homolog 49 n=1 Tax=Anabrus simplex TaxID=316456 RepID=UPI0035A346E4
MQGTISRLGSIRERPTKEESGKNPLQAEFVHPKKPKKKDDSLPPVSYYQLFRYSTWQERTLVILGILLAVASGVLMPGFIILYGEFTTLLVERNMENATTSKTYLLELFGGGKKLDNTSGVTWREAMIQDAAGFGIGTTVFSAAQFILDYLSIALLNSIALKQIGRIKKLFLQSVLRQDMSWYDTNNTADFASRMTGDLDKLQDGIGEKVGIFTYQMVAFFASIVVAFLHGWKLTLVVFSCAPIIIIATAIVAKVQSSLTAQELNSYGSAGAVVEEVLSAIRTVVAFGGQDKEADRYLEKLQPAKKMGTKRGMFSGFGAAVMWFITYCSYALAFWYGVTLILDSRGQEYIEYTPGILIIVLFGMLGGALNMGMALPHIEAFNMARGAAAVVFAVIERVPQIDSLGEGGLQPDKLGGDIEFKDVHFQYPARPEVKVLQGLNLKIKHGETVALVGSSGCGKSTVVQLVQRFYDPSQGLVMLDGIDVKTLNVGWLRNNIGVVGQEPALFATTIAENIRYGREDASLQDIELAAKQANAHDFISKLPQGYETMVGERGAQLSGGQKQRIAIARALVRHPGILLLDEATSALDLHSESIVQDALDRASQGRTTIIVAHRLSTIKNADRIVCLSGGQVVEQGTHRELMELKGHYHSLVTANDARHEDSQTHPEGDTEIIGDSAAAMINRQLSVISAHEDTEVVPEEEGDYEVSMVRILGMNKPEWPYILVGCIASGLVGATFPMFAVLFGEVYGVLSLPDEEEVRSQTNIYNILFLGIGVIAGLGSFLQSYMFSIAGVRLTTRLRINVFKAMLNQEMAWFDDEKHRVGALCARLSGDATSVQGATGSRIGSILQALSTLFVGAVIAMIYSWKLALVALAAVPVVFGSVFLEARVMHTEGVKEKLAIEEATKIAVETISNIRTVASLGGEASFLRRYIMALYISQKAASRKMRLRGVVFGLGQTAPFFGYALAFYYGGVLIANEGLPYKSVIMVGEALIFGTWMLGQSMAFAPNFGAAKSAAGRLFRMLDRKPLIASAATAESIPSSELGAGINYSQIQFFYPTRPKVTILRGLDLVIKPGQTVALVGPSGCGKSTCIQLLQRLYDPVSGSVAMDGRDISSLPLDGLRSQLGIVSQEPVLFDRTIAENIAYGDNSRQVSVDEIIAAAKKANIHSFVTALPLGYETRLGAKGTQLSGGQKQRIAIARALVRNPRVLLLDEATSALDNQSEKVVQEALDQAREGRTCITIAHRLATVQQADVICVLNNGAVSEMGSHSQLLAKRGLYYEMHLKSLQTQH